MNRKITVIIVICGVLGIILSVYLWILEAKKTLPYCPISGCEQVLKSSYSNFLGLPISGWGVMFYFTITVLALSQLVCQKRLTKILLIIAVLFGIAFTLYLRYIEIFVLKRICMWCWGSVFLVVTLAVSIIIENWSFIKKIYNKLFQTK